MTGFPDEKVLVEAIASELQASFAFASQQTFTAGELQILGPTPVPRMVVIATNIHAQAESLWRACFLATSARIEGAKSVALLAPWIAYGRQDRAAKPGEAPGGLIVAQWLQDAFDHIFTFDAHSARFMNAFRGKLHNIHGSPLLFETLKSATIVVAPDEGARDRAQEAGNLLRLPIAVMQKTRTNGQVSVTLPQESRDWNSQIPLLVDDMTDSGGTLITAASVLKDAGAQSILAFVPHVLRGSVLRSRSEGVINRIEMVYDHEMGSYSPRQLSLLTASLLSSIASLKA